MRLQQQIVISFQALNVAAARRLVSPSCRDANSVALTTTLSCGAIAVLCSGCMFAFDTLEKFGDQRMCDGLRNQFNHFQVAIAKGEGINTVKLETEAEIKEALKSHLEESTGFWKKWDCPGSLTDPG